MRKLILLCIVAAIAWQAQSHYRAGLPDALPIAAMAAAADDGGNDGDEPTETFSCDGRTHCSQMTSCAQANYFLHNCPGVKMDGDHDGIACEQQWCH